MEYLDQYKIERNYHIKHFWGKKISNDIDDGNLEKMSIDERKKHQRMVKVKIYEPNALDGGKLALTIGNQIKKDADIAKLLDDIIPYLQKYAVLIFPGNFKDG
jgi:hypothetical protein